MTHPTPRGEASAHTPGPWRVAPASNYAGTEINVDAATRAFVCSVGHRGDSEAEANGRLIAAAPEMLDMLVRCSRVMRSHEALDEFRAKVDTLIAKAAPAPSHAAPSPDGREK